MTNNSERGIFRERRFLMKATIVKMLDNLSDYDDIVGIKETLKWVTDLCEEGIVKEKLISKIIVTFKNSNNTLVSTVGVEIDWNKYDISIERDGKHVRLDRYLIQTPASEDGFDFTIKSISTKLEELRKFMLDTKKYLGWKRCSGWVYWVPGADSDAVQRVKDIVGVGSESQRREELQNLHDFDAYAEVAPDKMPELSFFFKTLSPLSARRESETVKFDGNTSLFRRAIAFIVRCLAKLI